MWLDDWGNGDDGVFWEPGIDLCRCTLAVNGRSGSWNARPLASASTHALARRLQRGGGTIAQAIADMAPAELWGAIAGDGDPTTIAIPTLTGVWFGRMISLRSEQYGLVRPPALRTWLHDHELRDEQLAQLRYLRDFGPTHRDAPEVFRKLAG
jgi:hypothetical protein